MSIAITLTYWHIGLLMLSAGLFIFATVICHWQGMFEGSDTYGIDTIFIITIYYVLWVIPSLAAWAIYATWFVK